MNRTDLPALPRQIRKLPKDARGYPVPWFVAWFDGKPDFRVVARGKIDTAHLERRCWTCGEPLQKDMTFVIGPMCSINRVSTGPPAITSALCSRPRLARS